MSYFNSFLYNTTTFRLITLFISDFQMRYEIQQRKKNHPIMRLFVCILKYPDKMNILTIKSQKSLKVNLCVFTFFFHCIV